MSCDCNTLVIGEAGPQGPQGFGGINGTNGTNGVNSFTRTTFNFTQPNVLSNVTVSVSNSLWMALGQTVYISQAGYYEVMEVPSTISVVLKLTQIDQIDPTEVVSSNRIVNPSAKAPELSSNFASLDVNQGYVSYNPVFRVSGSTGFPIIWADADINRVGIGVSPSGGTQTLVVGGGIEATGDFLISYGVVKASRLQVGSPAQSSKSELTKSLFFNKVVTVTLAGTVGACQRVSSTCTGAALGDVVTVGYALDPVTNFEDSVSVSAVVSAANTVNLFFQNYTNNEFPGANVNLKIVVNTYTAAA